MKKIIIFFILLMFSPALSVFSLDKYKAEDDKALQMFSKNIRQIQSQYEKSGITSKELEKILGKPEDKQHKSVKLDGGKEVWIYFHPSYASVRYLFVFNKEGRLMMMTSVQNLHSKIGDVYYSVEKFLN